VKLPGSIVWETEWILGRVWTLCWEKSLTLTGNRTLIPRQSSPQCSRLTNCDTVARIESYVTTDGQSASLSWNKAPIWGLRSVFISVRLLRVCWCGTLSLTKGIICRLKFLLALASAVILGYESLGTRDHLLLSQIRDFPLWRLLPLAGLRGRYSTPPPHGILPGS
jgi:hypothetical protein